MQEYSKSWGELDLVGLIDALAEQTRASSAGDKGRAEAMLAVQAHILDAIFNSLARRAINSEYMDKLERYLKLALRAQSQCRATWEALGAIRNPPVAGHVRQANIAHGPQQVNNAPAEPDSALRARENLNLQSELLEEKDGEWLDPRTARTSGQADPAMATVGEIDGTEDPGR